MASEACLMMKRRSLRAKKNVNNLAISVVGDLLRFVDSESKVSSFDITSHDERTGLVCNKSDFGCKRSMNSAISNSIRIL